MTTNIAPPARLAAALVAALAASLALGLAPAGAAEASLPGTSNGGVRIMPLGDSITHGGATSAYRDEVAATLAAAGHPVDFVGTMEGGTTASADRDNEGHPGWTIDMLDLEVGHWLFAADPRTVLLQAGTNDILYGDSAATAASQLATLIDHILAYRPGVQLFVAQLPPLFNDRYQTVVDFNALIPGIVAARGPSVHVVDLFPGLVHPEDYFPGDAVHPDESGYAKIAPRWAQALLAVPASLTPLPAGPAAPVGSTISLKAWNGAYVSAWQDHGHLLEAFVPHVAAWERFAVVDAGGGWVGLYSVGSARYVTTVVTPQAAPLVASATQLTPSEMFRWIEVAPGKVVLVSAATSGFVFVQSEQSGTFVYGHGRLAYADSVLEWQVAP